MPDVDDVCREKDGGASTVADFKERSFSCREKMPVPIDSESLVRDGCELIDEAQAQIEPEPDGKDFPIQRELARKVTSLLSLSMHSC